jgi:hypothetical protein
VTTAVHQPSDAPAPQRWTRHFAARDVSVSLAIAVIWIVVLLEALFGPDLVASNGGTAQFTRVPSAIFLAFFAWLATRTIAKCGFGRPEEDPPREPE